MAIDTAQAIFESFDGVATYTQLLNMGEWVNVINGLAFDAAGFTGQALKGTNSSNQMKRFLTVTQVSGFRMGFRYKTPSIAGGQNIAFTAAQKISNGAAINPFVLSRQGAALQILTFPAASVITPSFLVVNTWYYIECRYVLGNPGVIEIRVDRIVAATGTPVTNTDVSTAGTRELNLSPDSGGFIDDFYLVKDADGYLGSVRIQPSRPAADGNYAAWIGSDGDQVNNRLLVDEQSTDDTDFIESAIDGDKDSAIFAPVTAYAGHNLVAVQATSRAAWLAVAKKLRHFTRVAGVDYPQSDITLSNALLGRKSIMATNPATGNPWTFAEVNAGIELGKEQRP